MVSYDEHGRITDFGSLEVQAVYISGNIRAPFEYFMQNHAANTELNWTGKPNYPRPDYLSSSRKRLAPQLLFKGGIFHAWRKKQVVAINRGFYNTLPQLVQVDPQEADLAWLIYDLKLDEAGSRYELTKGETIYTNFHPTMLQITTAVPGAVEDFLGQLQAKLDEKLDNNPPDAPTLADTVLT